MNGSDLPEKSYAFMITKETGLQSTIIVTLLILVWGVVYMGLINYRLNFFFNETVCNSLIGIFLGITVGSSVPLKAIVQFFLPWENFEDNILPFLIMYPASKLCTQSSRKQLRMTVTFAIFSTILCVSIISGAIVAYMSTKSTGYFMGKDNQLSFHHVMYAIHVGASLSMHDAYLCVHNFPEIRGNSQMRGFLSSYGLVSMSFALELRQMTMDLSSKNTLVLSSIIGPVLKRALFVPLVSVLLGVTAGLISSFITKHSSFLHVQQEMVVLPCTNYISYILARKTGLSSIITSVACEMIQNSFCIHNLSEASKITYKSMLADSSKVLGFFCTFSLGFFFGSVESRFLWKYVTLELVLIFFGVCVAARVFSAFVSYFCVKRLGFKVRDSMMQLQVLIHTMSTPSLLSLINLQQYNERFQVCLTHLLLMQWSLFIVCTAVNIINVPLVGLVYKRLKIEPDSIDGQTEPIIHVIFRLMYSEMNQQISYLSGRRRRLEYIALLCKHIKKSFQRYVISLGFMSVPERRSHILSAFNQTISDRSNVIDQRRKSVKSKDQTYATQVCARFIVKNLCFEGFSPDDIVDYFFNI